MVNTPSLFGGWLGVDQQNLVENAICPSGMVRKIGYFVEKPIRETVAPSSTQSSNVGKRHIECLLDVNRMEES